MDGLTTFIVKAKAQTYVGTGASVAPSRPGAHDLVWQQGAWSYRDSYFGGTNFAGQEVVWHDDVPVWAMNYFGAVLRPDLIDGERAAGVIRAALIALYASGRFLGGWRFEHGPYVYVDQSKGDVDAFTGQETIFFKRAAAYRLTYQGGLVFT